MLTFITLDSIVNGSTNWLFELVVGFLFLQVLPVIGQLIAAPFTDPSMMWIVMPLLASMTLIQLYYGRYRHETLGWSGAFGNSVSLIFVSVNLMQVLFNRFGWTGLNLLDPVTNKVFLVLGIGLLSLVQLVINFFHLIPKKIAFFVNSSIPTTITAYVAIILVYTDITLSWATIVGALILLACMIFLFRFIKGLIPMSKEAESYVKAEERKALKARLSREKRELRQERAADAKLIDSVIVVGVIIGVFFALLVLETFLLIPVWLSLLVQGLVYLIITIAILNYRGLGLSNLNFDNEGREIVYGVLLSFVLFFVVIGLIYVLWFIVPESDRLELLVPTYAFIGINPFITLLVFGLLMPISSELIFRGVIQRSLRGKLGRKAALIIQAVMFALVTFSFSVLDGFPNIFIILSIPPLFVAGLLLGWFRDRWGLESSLSAHLVFNILGLILMFATI